MILPPYLRRSPKVGEVLPLLYLYGLSSGDFVPALEEAFGTEAGLLAPTITRPTKQWQEERKRFVSRDLSEREVTDRLAQFINEVAYQARKLCTQKRTEMVHSIITIHLTRLRSLTRSSTERNTLDGTSQDG